MLARTHLTDITVPQVGTVVSLSDVKSQANIDTDSDDALLLIYIAAAQEQISAITGTILSTQTIVSSFHDITYTKYGRLPFVQIDRFPLTSVTSIEYWDGSAYILIDDTTYNIEQRNAAFPRIQFQVESVPIFASSYLMNQPYPLRVTSVVGYDTLPTSLKLAVMQYATMLYDNRGDCGCEEGCLPGVIMNMVARFVVRGNFG
jgi:uncharacterized phiE125 gp8 family phage protein